MIFLTPRRAKLRGIKMSSPRMALMRPPFLLMVILFSMTRTHNVHAFSCLAPWRLHLRTTYATSSRRIRAAAGIRGATCQLFPVENLFGGKRNADYHEEKVRYHEERLAYHRAELLKIREDRFASIERQKSRAGSGTFEARVVQTARNEGRPASICFVDLSDTCRSPAAAAIMRTRVEAVGLARDFEVRSRSTGAGVRDWFKDEIRASVEPASFDPRMLAHASKRGLAGAFPAQRASVAISREDLTTADIIVCMDKSNEREVFAAAQHWGVRGVETKLRLLTSYCRSGTRTTDIPDPYYGGLNTGQTEGQGDVQSPIFERVLDLMEDGCKGLLRDCCPDAA